MKIAIIGAGNLGLSIAKGFITADAGDNQAKFLQLFDQYKTACNSKSRTFTKIRLVR